MTRGPWRDAELIRMLNGYMFTGVLDATLELGLLDAIGEATVTVEDLASTTSTHEQTLARVLRALAALEILTETQPNHFQLAPRGRLLLPGTPGSVHELAVYLLGDWLREPWSALDRSVRTGTLAEELVDGPDHENGLDRSEGSQMWATVGRLMTEHTRAIAPVVVDAYDFSRFSTVVDVGGGSGPFIAAVLAANPRLRGILFDLEAGAGVAADVLAEAGVADRCELRVGDFFESVPPADLYLCKSVVFNWPDDEQVATIFANCRRTMTSDQGRLLLAEQMLPAVVDGSMLPHVYLDDVGGVVTIGGRFRTEPEYRALLDAAGFTLTVHPLPSAPEGFSLLEAEPV